MLSQATPRKCLQHLTAQSFSSTASLPPVFLASKTYGLACRRNHLRPSPVCSPVATRPSVVPTIAVATGAVASFSTTSPQCRPKPPPEDEIIEKFVKGSGPGGQKINKTNSAVQLKHIPTGIVVKCQETRSREINRKKARSSLAIAIDNHHNGQDSWEAMKIRSVAAKKRKSVDKKKAKYRARDEERRLSRDENDQDEDENEAENLLDSTETGFDMEERNQSSKLRKTAIPPGKPFRNRPKPKIVLRRDD